MSCSPEFTAALEHFQHNNFTPIRAYFGLETGKRWAHCDACGELAVLTPSGLLGKFTCAPCEADIAERMTP